MNDDTQNMEPCQEKLYSFKELHKMKIYSVLLEYLEIEIIKRGRGSYITQKSLNKVLKFKEENPNTRVILQKYTYMNKYGVENPQQCKEIKDKTNKTIKEKYGVDNVSQSQKIKDKKSETLRKHYGENVTNPMDCEEIIRKVKDNWKNKTQDEKDSLTEKTKKTKLERYGNENYNNEKSISTTRLNRSKNDIQKEIERSRKTKLEKYGDENYNNFKKGIKTKLEKYGVKSFTNSEKAMRTKIENDTVVSKKTYTYNDLFFASSWELYYYIYQKEICNNNITKGEHFEYMFDDKLCIYECDFLVNGTENVEIKGNQYLDSNNNLYFPYINQTKVDVKEMQRRWTAKQKCMEENNVKMISKLEIEPIIEIVNKRFGKDYIEHFRNN